MRILSVATFATGLAFLMPVHADTPVPGKTRVMGQVVVGDGSVVDWPSCIEGETPGVEYHRPNSSHYQVGAVEVQSSFGSWAFHIQAFDSNHHPLTGDALKQVQVPATLYCKPSADHG